jgi:hypothetical protein
MYDLGMSDLGGMTCLAADRFGEPLAIFDLRSAICDLRFEVSAPKESYGPVPHAESPADAGCGNAGGFSRSRPLTFHESTIDN